MIKSYKLIVVFNCSWILHHHIKAIRGAHSLTIGQRSIYITYSRYANSANMLSGYYIGIKSLKCFS